MTSSPSPWPSYFAGSPSNEIFVDGRCPKDSFLLWSWHFSFLILSSLFLLFYFFVFLTVGAYCYFVPDFVFYSLLHLINTYHFTSCQQFFTNYFSIFEITIIICNQCNVTLQLHLNLLN